MSDLSLTSARTIRSPLKRKFSNSATSADSVDDAKDDENGNGLVVDYFAKLRNENRLRQLRLLTNSGKTPEQIRIERNRINKEFKETNLKSNKPPSSSSSSPLKIDKRLSSSSLKSSSSIDESSDDEFDKLGEDDEDGNEYIDCAQAIERQWKIERKRVFQSDSATDSSSDSSNAEKLRQLDLAATKLIAQMNAEVPNLKQILQADLSDANRVEVATLYGVYGNTEISEEKVKLQRQIRDKLLEPPWSMVATELKARILNSNNSNTSSSSSSSSQEQKQLEQRIFELRLPEEQVRTIYQKYLLYRNYSSEASDSKAKIKEWIDYAMQLPTEIKPLKIIQDVVTVDQNNLGRRRLTPEKIAACLDRVKAGLDAELYGMQSEKEELLIIINSILENSSNPDDSSNTGNSSRNLSLGFVGEPGVGKTDLIKALGKVLGLPVIFVPMAGCNSVDYLLGSGQVFEGSQPGAVCKGFIKMGCKNGIMCFDEIDKIENTPHGKSAADSLLHILDPLQNTHFKDSLLDELLIDLSLVWTMYTMNDISQLSRPLQDRMHIIHVKSPNKEERFQILKQFSIPRILDGGFHPPSPPLSSFSLPSSSFSSPSSLPLPTIPNGGCGGMQSPPMIFLDEALRHLIGRHQEMKSGDRQLQGVRGLNKLITAIVRRVNLLRNLNLPSQASKPLVSLIPQLSLTSSSASSASTTSKLEQPKLKLSVSFAGAVKIVPGEVPIVDIDAVDKLVFTNRDEDGRGEVYRTFYG